MGQDSDCAANAHPQAAVLDLPLKHFDLNDESEMLAISQPYTVAGKMLLLSYRHSNLQVAISEKCPAFFAWSLRFSVSSLFARELEIMLLTRRGARMTGVLTLYYTVTAL